jgi:competence protein ComEA
MAFFTNRDRIAISLIAVLIILGWGTRFYFSQKQESSEIKIIKNAVAVPESLSTPENLKAVLPELNFPININTASRDVLESLPMIGQVKAQSIIEYREKIGPFKKKSDIMKVNGIGKGIFKRISDKITAGEDSLK